MKWKKVSLRDYTTKIGSGVTPKGGASVYQDDGVALFRSQNIYNGSFFDKGLAFINEVIAEKMKSVEVLEGDVLLNITGDSVARCCYAPVDFLPGRVNQHVAIVRADKEKLHSKFLMYQLISPFMQNTMLSYAEGAGATRNALTKGIIEDLQINLPPLPTQRKIASILSAYDDLIENNLKRIKLLEEKAQLHYIQYKPIEKIALQDIADYLGRGVTPKYEEGSGFYAINQKANKGSLLEYSQFKSLDSKLEVPDDKFAKWGDLLINSLGEGTLGRVHFYTDKSDLYAVDQHMSIFRTQKQHYTFYLYQFLSSNYGQGLLDSLKKGGTNMTMLNISDLRQLIVSFPSEKELIELWNVCKPLFQLKQTLITQNTKLREARDILLPKLMNGQIEV